MNLSVLDSVEELGAKAASLGATVLRDALANQPRATIIVATGASQFATLAHLVHEPGIDWGRVDAFHLDEYLGIDETHGASFRKFLRERFVDLLPSKLGSFEAIRTEGDPTVECRRLENQIRLRQVDVAFIGIGENGHLAFNDPPADFDLKSAYHVVELDEACRKQQLGEGWFPTLDAVPRQAISMTIHEILRAKRIVCSVPDARKAVAVRAALEGPLDPNCPASILRTHPAVELLIDRPAGSLLTLV